MTRKEEVCFKSNVQYFGGNLLMILPKNNNVDLINLCKYFNSYEFKTNYLYSKRFIIKQKNIKDCYIPNKILL